jgi:hypothetical protein
MKQLVAAPGYSILVSATYFTSSSSDLYTLAFKLLATIMMQYCDCRMVVDDLLR